MMAEENRLAAIERILTYLSLCDDLEFRFGEKDPDVVYEAQLRFMALPLTYFNRAEPFHDVERLCNLTKTYERIHLLPGAVQPRDVEPDEWDCSWITNRIDLDESSPWKEKRAIYATGRHRRVPLAEVRGKFPLKTGLIVERSQAFIFHDGTYTSSREYVEKFPDQNCWVVGQPCEVVPEKLTEYQHTQLEMMLSMSFTRHFEWQVELGYHGMPTLALTVDPPAARTVFKLRDLPPGKERREALRHWVGEHFRHQSICDSTEELIKIWPYLRGGNEFRWHGIECRIHPSRHDLIRAKKYDEYRAIQRQNNLQKKHAKRRKR